MNEPALAFPLGRASPASPCLLPLYPGFIAYLAGNSRSIAGTRASGLLGLLVLLGVLSAMVVVAVVPGPLPAPRAAPAGARGCRCSRPHTLRETHHFQPRFASMPEPVISFGSRCCSSPW